MLKSVFLFKNTHTHAHTQTKSTKKKKNTEENAGTVLKHFHRESLKKYFSILGVDIKINILNHKKWPLKGCCKWKAFCISHCNNYTPIISVGTLNS